MRSWTITSCALILSACASEPVTVYKTQEVKVEVPIYCKVEVPRVAGPDFADKTADYYDAAVYAEGRIIGLRTEVNSLRKALDACGKPE